MRRPSRKVTFDAALHHPSWQWSSPLTLEHRGDETANVLLIEDNPADIRLVREVLEGGRLSTQLHVVPDGEKAIAFLRQEPPYADESTPDLILLDFNLPIKDGREVLRDIKRDPALCHIPIVVLTSSTAASDVERAYELQANCFVTKPIDLNEFFAVMRSIEDFWLGTARLKGI